MATAPAPRLPEQGHGAPAAGRSEGSSQPPAPLFSGKIELQTLYVTAGLNEEEEREMRKCERDEKYSWDEDEESDAEYENLREELAHGGEGFRTLFEKFPVEMDVRHPSNADVFKLIDGERIFSGDPEREGCDEIRNQYYVVCTKCGKNDVPGHLRLPVRDMTNWDARQLPAAEEERLLEEEDRKWEAEQRRRAAAGGGGGEHSDSGSNFLRSERSVRLSARPVDQRGACLSCKHLCPSCEDELLRQQLAKETEVSNDAVQREKIAATFSVLGAEMIEGKHQTHLQEENGLLNEGNDSVLIPGRSVQQSPALCTMMKDGVGHSKAVDGAARGNATKQEKVIVNFEEAIPKVRSDGKKALSTGSASAELDTNLSDGGVKPLEKTPSTAIGTPNLDDENEKESFRKELDPYMFCYYSANKGLYYETAKPLFPLGGGGGCGSSSEDECSDETFSEASVVNVYVRKSDMTPQKICGSAVRHLFIDTGELHICRAGNKTFSLSHYFPNLLSFQYTFTDELPFHHECNWSSLRHLTQLRKLVLNCGRDSHQGASRAGVRGLTRGILPLKDTLEHLELGTFKHGSCDVLRMYEQLVNLKFLVHVGELCGADNTPGKRWENVEGLKGLDLSRLTKLRALKVKGDEYTDLGCCGVCMRGEKVAFQEWSEWHGFRRWSRMLSLNLPVGMRRDLAGGFRVGAASASSAGADGGHAPNSSTTSACRPKCIIALTDDPSKVCSVDFLDAFAEGGVYSHDHRLVSLKQYESALLDPEVRYQVTEKKRADLLREQAERLKEDAHAKTKRSWTPADSA